MAAAVAGAAVAASRKIHTHHLQQHRRRRRRCRCRCRGRTVAVGPWAGRRRQGRPRVARGLCRRGVVVGAARCPAKWVNRSNTERRRFGGGRGGGLQTYVLVGGNGTTERWRHGGRRTRSATSVGGGDRSSRACVRWRVRRRCAVPAHERNATRRLPECRPTGGILSARRPGMSPAAAAVAAAAAACAGANVRRPAGRSPAPPPPPPPVLVVVVVIVLSPSPPFAPAPSPREIARHRTAGAVCGGGGGGHAPAASGRRRRRGSAHARHSRVTQATDRPPPVAQLSFARTTKRPSFFLYPNILWEHAYIYASYALPVPPRRGRSQNGLGESLSIIPKKFQNDSAPCRNTSRMSRPFCP